MQRIRTEVRRFHIGEGDDQHLRRELAHDLARHVEGEFVSRSRAAAVHESGNRVLDGRPHPRIELIRRVEDVPAQPFVVAPFHCALQFGFHLASVRHVGGASLAQCVHNSHQHQLLGEHHIGAIGRTIVGIRACTDQAG